MKINKFLLSVFLVAAVSACSRAEIRHNLGVKADAPDEFLIGAKKNPLVIPKNLDTPLPIPEKAEKKHLKSYDPDETRKELFGDKINPTKSEEMSGIETAVLDKSEADRVKADVRKTVENEYKNRSSIFGTAPGSILESIVDPFGYNRARPEIVDGEKENQRIKKALAKGEKVNTSKIVTKSID